MARTQVEVLLVGLIVFMIGFNIWHTTRESQPPSSAIPGPVAGQGGNLEPRAVPKATRAKHSPQRQQAITNPLATDDDDDSPRAQAQAQAARAKTQANKAPTEKLDPVLERLKHNPELHDMLNLGGDGYDVLFHEDSPTHKLWLWSEEPDKTRCFLRSQSNQALLERCLEQHDAIQTMYRDGAYFGFKDADGDSCLVVDPEDSLHFVPCKRGDKRQEWDVVPGKGLVSRVDGRCATQLPYVMHMKMKPCTDPVNQWILDVDLEFIPYDLEGWMKLFGTERTQLLKEAQAEVDAALARTSLDVPTPTSHRRIVVFYGEGGLGGFFVQLSWWIMAWQKLELDHASQRFDILVLGDKRLGNMLRAKFPFCEQKDIGPASEPPSDDAAGVCWFSEFIGASRREPKKYDGWTNSIECLVNPTIRPFLEKYSQLLRADADTFPTPRMRDFYREDVYFGTQAGYSTRYSRIKIERASTAAGLQHHSITNIGSTYYGPASVVLRVADLTLACGFFARAYLFSPGTPCKLPANLRPKTIKCGWTSEGLHEGVLLLYSQEMAVNHLYGIKQKLSFHQWTSMDVPTIEPHPVCRAYMLHVYHGAERFSKFRLSDGTYRDLDVTDYDLTIIRDYATWLALLAAGQGQNLDKPLAKLRRGFAHMCDGIPMQND
ncbi:uncharacterized protein MONBRDRAFT_4769 [Monosiga brevicollis MX1]|uniref:DUF7164 domain-containing protein n=1 Tax=Monosiga brevicollis TaxID=81824 RepID=A9UNW0_MONBE|nr:uncharacterized protein MONBRDRAFT_4769 [Monosiga brevicollis MX1]EDQ92767.1 predicted protein [Monosiga brevicollis MX1]|eukprot:XP_001742529.1 hypothetical protein [Monosiga brevicollis MX1]